MVIEEISKRAKLVYVSQLKKCVKVLLGGCKRFTFFNVVAKNRKYDATKRVKHRNASGMTQDIQIIMCNIEVPMTANFI